MSFYQTSLYWFLKLFDMVSICLTLLWLDMVSFQNFLFSLHWNVIDKDDEVIGRHVNMDCLSTLVMCHIHLSWILMKVLENCEQSIICTRRPIHSFWSRFMKLNHRIDKDGACGTRTHKWTYNSKLPANFFTVSQSNSNCANTKLSNHKHVNKWSIKVGITLNFNFLEEMTWIWDLNMDSVIKSSIEKESY
jgi:hypothetical protein